MFYNTGSVRMNLCVCKSRILYFGHVLGVRSKELQSSVVYKFSCPQASYIGKTDRCLMTRLKEHARSKESEIYKHINSCEHFLYYRTLFNFPHTLFNLDDFTSEQSFSTTVRY